MRKNQEPLSANWTGVSPGPGSVARFAQALGNWSEGGGPISRRLANSIRALIETVQLPPGSLLPAERPLAALLEVSRTTVVAAYETLRQEARIESRQGSGTRVRESSSPGPLPAAASSPFFLQNPVYRGLIEGSADTIEFLGAHLPGTGFLPSDLGFLQRELPKWTRRHGYVPAGLPELRQAVARHVSEWGLPTSENQVLITSGAQQAIGLAGALCLRPGDAVALEDPTYLGAVDVFGSLGARLVPVGMDRQGARLDLLREALTRTPARLLYLMPTFQNPTGALMPERARRELARLCDERRLPLVEDHTLSDLSLGAEPPPPVAAFSKSGLVMTVGSLSKLFWGGLRIGWIRAPEPLLARLLRVKLTLDLGCSLPSALLAVKLLSRADRAKRTRRREVRTLYERLVSLLKRHLPSWSFVPPAGGLSLWVRLPHGDADSFAQVALRHGVSVVPGTLASPTGGCSDHVRLPFVLEPGRMTEGVERLARAWEAFSPATRRDRESPPVLV